MEDFHRLPDNWNEERDLQYFVDIFGETKKPKTEIYDHIAGSWGNFARILEAAYHFLNARSATPLPPPSRQFGSCSEIDWYLIRFHLLVPGSSADPGCVERLRECENLYFLSYLRYEWLLTREDLKRNPVWLYPLVELYDSVLYATEILREAMICEFDGFRQFLEK